MDDKFLEEALIRYKRYLCLKILNKATFLVPCYDIDLMWHAHQVFFYAPGNETYNEIVAFLSRYTLFNMPRIVRRYWATRCPTTTPSTTAATAPS